MKILHCSDIHLGKKPFGSSEYSNMRYEDYFRAFDNIVDLALKEKVEVFMIAGDFFDKKELLPKSLKKTENILKKLKDQGITVLIVEGNHDNISKGNEDNSWINYLQEGKYLKRLSYNVEIVDDKEIYNFEKFTFKDIHFYGLGYPGHVVDGVMEKLSESLDEKEKNIVIVHTAIAEGDFLAGTVSSGVVDLFKEKSIYIAGGHFHSYYIYPKEKPLFYLSGSPEYWNVQNELNQKKGSIIFDSETGEHKFYPSKTRNRVIKKIKIESKSLEEFKLEFDKIVKNFESLNLDEIVIMNLELKYNFFVNVKECENLIEKLGAIKCFVRVKYPNSGSDSKNGELLSLKEIEESVIKKWEVFGGDFKESARVLKELKEYQLEVEEERYFELFDHFLDRLTDEESKNGGDIVED